MSSRHVASSASASAAAAAVAALNDFEWDVRYAALKARTAYYLFTTCLLLAYYLLTICLLPSYYLLTTCFVVSTLRSPISTVASNCLPPTACYLLLATCCLVVAACCLLLASCCLMVAACCLVVAACCVLLCCLPFASCQWRFAICHLPFAAYNLLLAAYSTVLVTLNSPFTTHHSSLIMYPLLTTHCILPTMMHCVLSTYTKNGSLCTRAALPQGASALVTLGARRTCCPCCRNTQRYLP